MTYAELYVKYWDAEPDDRPGILVALDPATRTAWNVLEMLTGRGGFDHWWEGEISNECQDEIFSEMVELIKKAA